MHLPGFLLLMSTQEGACTFLHAHWDKGEGGSWGWGADSLFSVKILNFIKYLLFRRTSALWLVGHGNRSS